MLYSGKNERAWYLIYTKPRAETVAQENLQRQGYETYLPLVQEKRRQRGKYRTVIEAMFSRYLFIHLNCKTDNWAPIRSTVGVSNLVRFSGYPSLVPQELIDSIKSLENEQGVHEIKGHDFQTGDTVYIVDGVFAGLKAIYQAKTSQERVNVLLNIAGQFTRVNLNINELSYA